MIKFNHNPNFENLKNFLFNKGGQKLSLIELGIHPLIKKEILGKPILTLKDDIDFMYNMGYDFVKIQPIIKFKSKEVTNRNSDDEYKNAPDRAWATEDSGIITNLDEFYQYPFPDKKEIDYSCFEEASKLLPEGMGVIGQYGDIFTLVWELMGFETFAFAMFENPELIDLLYKNIESIILSMFETMVDFDCVGALWYSDDIAYATGLMVDPSFYKQYLFPSLKKIGDLAKRKGIPFIYHTDGKLWDVLDDIVECGVTALHPIEPKSMDIFELRDKYYNKLAFCGGIEVDTLARGSENEVKDLIKFYLDKLPGTCSWIVGSSNSIPDYVNVKNYLTMLEMVHNYNNM